MAILNGAAQSADALTRRLMRRGFDAETAAAAVGEMRGYGYVDDAALAGSIVRRRRDGGYGVARIAADLRARGIEAGAIDAALATVDRGDDTDAALAVARRAARSGAGDDPAVRDRDRRRVAGLLQRRGFGSEVIRAVLRRLDEERVDPGSEAFSG